jgi:hypothetical protein
LATERQIAANRANAKLSSGPKTLAGKLKSSGNAFRHGLSRSVKFEPSSSAKIDAIARMLAGEQTTDGRLASAADFARAQLELQRIRSTRNDLLAKINLSDYDTSELRRLVALDRYERYALTKRRRASVKL